ncbi:MAG: hypothetical protein M1828_003206 [Chrysothrix sp. TS-e1954]|nr:MAG: hypothetical protein M1828_003206 [Chrysothrix sp. TS-e1954]
MATDLKPKLAMFLVRALLRKLILRSASKVIFTELIDRIPALSKDATQTLILVHRRELVEQAARHCQARYPERSVDVEMGNMHASGVADITIASVQSINSRDRIDKFSRKHYKLILVDEAHHAVAPVYRRILEHFGVPSKVGVTSPALVGVSATWSRFDGLALGEVFEEIVFNRDAVDLIGEKWLAPCIFTTVKSNADISRVRSSSNGDFAIDALAQAVNNEETNRITVRAWLERAQDRNSTLVFGVDVAHVISLTNTFRQHGIGAEYVTASTKVAERGRLIDAFKNGEFPVLLNCGIFTEGTDIPSIDCVLLARPSKSRSLLSQMIGRGMRLYPGKENCHIIDMVASLKEGIVTAPTLFGLDPDAMVEEAKPEDMKKMEAQKTEEAMEAEKAVQVAIEEGKTGPKLNYTDYESVSDLLLNTLENRHIRSISPYNWLQVNQTRFVLTNGNQGAYLAIEDVQRNDRKQYETKVFRRIPTTPGKSQSPWSRGSRIGLADTFDHAVHGADKFASENFTAVFISLRGRIAQWRNQPATQNQLDLLNKRLGHDDEERWEAGDVTKGEAADITTKLTFGAKGQFSRMASSRRREAQVNKRNQARVDRETVKLGPLPRAT